MRLSSLHIFLSVVETGSFSAAARIEHITQPAVSSIIKSLEEELGATLLTRFSGHHSFVVPTVEGKLLESFAQMQIKAYHKLLLDIAKAEDEPMNVFVVASPTISATVLPNLLNGFKSEYPQIKVKASSVNDYPVPDLGGTEFEYYDIGFSPINLHIENLTFEKFFYDPIIPICKKTADIPDTIPLYEFKKQPFISRPAGGHTMTAISHALSNHHVRLEDLNNIMQVNANTDVMHAVSTGSGVGFITRALYEGSRNIESIRMFNIKGITIDRMLYIVLRKKHTLSTASTIFLNYARSLKWRSLYHYNTMPE